MVDVYTPHQHAKDNIGDFDDFMSVIHKLWTKIHNQDCIFTEDEPTGTDPEKVDLPCVVFDMAFRQHAEQLSEGRKPRQFKVFPDPEQDGHNITEATEWFDCIVEFKIFGHTKKEAREWKNKFESFMLGYLGYFKEIGLQDLAFMNEERPEVSTDYRQEFPHRLLRYSVRIQRTQIIRTIRLKDVEVIGKVQHQSGTTEELYPTRGSSEFLHLYNEHLKN